MDDETSRPAFGAWLVQQKDRKGWVGDLAKAAKSDPSFPKAGDADEVRDHLSKKGADTDMLEAIDDAERAWREG